MRGGQELKTGGVARGPRVNVPREKIGMVNKGDEEGKPALAQRETRTAADGAD